jgi:hypothetical protein
VLYVRRAFRLRPLFVPKNRFGPAIIDPIVLVMDDRGRLTKSPLSAAKSIAVYGYAGMGDDLAEGQASVSLPKYGSRLFVIAWCLYILYTVPTSVGLRKAPVECRCSRSEAGDM